ncbi:MAG: asparaginase [Fibrobacter sp.]|nr:asparaginase [Fibrobacter sp.]
MAGKKRIVVLATGGTIAGVGADGENLGYRSGQIAGADLVAAVPEVLDYADVSVEQICNVNSDDMTSEIWLRLARRVNELQADPSVDGIVITHGTDTMDETAYFLNLTVEGNKPVVMTGSMRPATAREPDGPANLVGAVRAAIGFVVDDVKPENNVWVYFGGELFESRLVQKCSASELQPMASDDVPAARDPLFFDVGDLTQLPKVNVVYFAADSDPRILEYAASVSEGLVIAGAGAGEFSLRWAESLARIMDEMPLPVVVCSRIHHGTVTLNKSLAPDAIAGGFLPPQKAAVLLRLILTQTNSVSKIRKIFARA